MSFRDRLRSSTGVEGEDGGSERDLTPLVVGVCSCVGAFAGSALAGSAVGVAVLAAFGALAGAALVWLVVRALA